MTCGGGSGMAMRPQQWARTTTGHLIPTLESKAPCTSEEISALFGPLRVRDEGGLCAGAGRGWCVPAPAPA